MNSKKFDQLHTGIPREDLKSRRKSLKQGHIGDGLPSGPEALKKEINAITSLLTEEAWAAAKRWIDENPGKIVIRKTEYGDLNSQLKITHSFITLTDQEYLDGIKDEGKNFYNYSLSLNDLASDTLFQAMKKWGEEKKLLPPDTVQYAIFERYKELLRQRDKNEGRPLGEIGRGLGTAISHMTMALAVIPVAYEKKFGRKINEKDYQILSRNVLTLIIKIAQTHLDIFGELEDRYSSPIPLEIKLSGRVPKFDSFTIVGEGQTMMLALKDSVFDGVKEKAKIEINARTECPAILSEGISGKSVISEIYDYVLDINKRLFLPKLKEAGVVQP
jgi:hypothetical protein